ESILPDQVIADGKYYQKHNRFKQYCFFGWELAMLWCLMGRKIPTYTVPQVVLNYLKTWSNTPIDETGGVTGRLSDMAREAGDYSFSLKAIRHACTLNYC
ncbi:MAG: hypothetical protein ACWGQW_03860, partial [bacterium]